MSRLNFDLHEGFAVRHKKPIRLSAQMIADIYQTRQPSLADRFVAWCVDHPMTSFLGALLASLVFAWWIGA
jgi:hypothetical protein